MHDAELNLCQRVHRFLLVATVFFDLVVDSVKPDKRIVALQRSLLPLFDFIYDFVGNSADSSRRNIDTLKLFNMTGNISIAHTKTIHRQYFALYFITD